MPIPHRITQRAARILHDKGIELTPQQVDDKRQKAYTTIRLQMKEKGWILPEDDLHMLAIIAAMQQHELVLQRDTEAGTVLAHPDFI